MTVGKSMNELEQVEQELGELRQQLEQAFGVLDALAQVQAEFEDLAKTHQTLKIYADESKINNKSFGQFQEKVNERLIAMERMLEASQQELRGEFINAQGELSNASRNLRTELAQQMGQLKREIDKQFLAFQQEWTGPRDEMQAYVDEFESRVRTELRAVINRIEQSGFTPDHLDRIDKLSTQVQGLRTSLRNTDDRTRGAQGWAVAALVTAILALVTPVILQLSGFFDPPSSSPSPEETRGTGSP